MENHEAAEILQHYNDWRRGKIDEPLKYPLSYIGVAIDKAILILTQNK